MGINSNVVENYQTLEYGKFVEITDNSLYPPVSVVRYSYPDTSSAFPANSGLMPLSSIDIYPKYAVLAQYVEAPDILSQLSTIVSVLCAIFVEEETSVQLINFSVTTSSGTILVEWGDNTSDTINSNTLTNHTYTCPNVSTLSGFWSNIQPCI